MYPDLNRNCHGPSVLEQPLRRTYGILGFSWHCRERELPWRTERKPGEWPSAIWCFEAVLQKRQQQRQQTPATPKAALGKPAFVRGVGVAQPSRTFPPNPSRWRRSGFGWFRSLCGEVLSSSRNTTIMPKFRTNGGLSKRRVTEDVVPWKQFLGCTNRF